MNKKAFLCVEFISENGERNNDLSRFPANEQTVLAAIQFLKKDCSITISVQETEFDESGNPTFNPFVD